MAQEIIKHIHRVNALRDLANQLGVMPIIHQLQHWQCERLLVTHDDLAQQKRYQKAMAFFVDDNIDSMHGVHAITLLNNEVAHSKSLQLSECKLSMTHYILL